MVTQRPPRSQANYDKVFDLLSTKLIKLVGEGVGDSSTADFFGIDKSELPKGWDLNRLDRAYEEWFDFLRDKMEPENKEMTSPEAVKTVVDSHHITAALIVQRLVEKNVLAADLLADNLDEYPEDTQVALKYHQEQYGPELDKLAQFVRETINGLTEVATEWLALKDENI